VAAATNNRSIPSNNENVGAFYRNGPSQLNEQNDDNDDEDFTNDRNGTVTDLQGVTVAEMNNINFSVHDNNHEVSSTHMVEATLVDDIVFVTAVTSFRTITAHQDYVAINCSIHCSSGYNSWRS
jgi:hypothetical protein